MLLIRRTAVEIVLAFQFLTICPTIIWRPASPRETGRSMAYFPLAGATIGLALAGLDYLVGLAIPDPLRSVLVVGALVALTRGLHLDGLMDSCDGLFGGWSAERRLEIMRDSRIGSFGVLGATLDLLIRVTALMALPPEIRFPALVVVTALGRWSQVYATAAYPYARPEGLGAAYKRNVGRWQVAIATAVALVVSVGLFWPVGAALLIIAWVIAALFGRYVLARIPGQTGDTYGATTEIVEILLLVILTTGMVYNAA